MPDDDATASAARPARVAGAAVASAATPGAVPPGAAQTGGGQADGGQAGGGQADGPGPAGTPARGLVLTRGWALFLVAVGVWNWVIWPRFALAIWDDPRAWSTRVVGHGTPTGFLWIHAFLIIASVTVGTIVGILGIRALLRLRRKGRAA